MAPQKVRLTRSLSYFKSPDTATYRRYMIRDSEYRVSPALIFTAARRLLMARSQGAQVPDLMVGDAPRSGDASRYQFSC